MIDLQHHLIERFSVLRDSRRGAVFFVEHGMDAGEIDEVRTAVRKGLRSQPLESDWWDRCDLPLLVAATEVGYRYRGSGTDFWPALEAELEFELSPSARHRIRDLFVHSSQLLRGAQPPDSPWAVNFHLIAWPITHALLPLEFHIPFAMTLANLRTSVGDADDATLYRAVQVAASNPNARFATLLSDADVVVSLVRSLIGRDEGELSAEIVRRFSTDLSADHEARRRIKVAQSIQRAARTRPNAVPVPAVTRTKGSLQLRRVNNILLLEARFPLLEMEIADRLRRSLRRRRFAPQLWGVTTRVPSDQLLSGLPFAVKLSVLPEEDSPLFPDIDPTEIDVQDLAVLQGFELRLAPPHLFAVSADRDVGRFVHGSTITGHREYWALLLAEREALQGARTIGNLGPLRCVEIDPSNAAGAQALAQLGYQVRLGVSVRFAGTPAIDPTNEIPTFVAGDYRLLIPQRLSDGAVLEVDLHGSSNVIRASEVVRINVEPGDHSVRVSNKTDSREYAFRGVGAAPPPTPAVQFLRLSEERTVQALLGGRLSFAVDGVAPIEGLELTVDLDVGGRVLSATGPLGPIPQQVSVEHPVLKALLNEDVRDTVAGAASAMLRARVGHLAAVEWELERTVRPCWWELSDSPTLLGEDGPLRFGVVRADDPVRAPSEGTTVDGTYLLAPISGDTTEFSSVAPFTTLCLAPSRTHLRALSIAKPRLERRRRGSDSSVGLEDLAEAYLRWSLAETRSAIGDVHRAEVTERLEAWITEVCCGTAWVEAEATLPRRGPWGVLEEVCQELGVGRDDYLGLSEEHETEVRRLAMEEIRRSIPRLWARVGPSSDLDDNDYETLDRACARAYEVLAERYRRSREEELADKLGEADPGESPDRWEEAFSCVQHRIELRSLAAMLLPSNSVARLMSLQVGLMTVDDVVDELSAWASTARKAFAGALPTRDVLKFGYAVWVEPELALATDWRTALDTLLAERAVARTTRYLALRARVARRGLA